MSDNVSLGVLQQNRKDLGTTRRIVGKAIAHAMLSGEPSRQATAWHLASALDDQGVEVEYPIRNALKELGADYELVWVRPNGVSTAQAPETGGQLEGVLTAVISCVWEMSFHHEAPVRTWARDLTERLDELGVDVDDRLGALSRKRGKGPHLYDAFGFSYDLTRQHVDERGKRWEHTGGWTDTGVPMMRRDEPDGDSMTLPDLIRERGPLFAITEPVRSVAVSMASPWGDEPPF